MSGNYVSTGAMTAAFVFNDADARRGVQNLTKGFEQLQQKATQAGRAMEGISAPAAGAAAGMGRLGRDTANANLFMQQAAFGLQDMPFFLTNFRMGMMAVSNNLGFLIVQYGQLKSTLKSGESVWGTLLATLKGPAGLIVGFSVAIAVLQTLSMAFSKSTQEADKFNDQLADMAAKTNAFGDEKGLIALLANAQKVRAELQKQKDAQVELVQTMTAQGDIVVSTIIKDQKRYDQLSKQLNTLGEIEAAYKEQLETLQRRAEVERMLEQVDTKQKTELQNINAELEQLNKLKQNGVLYDRAGMSVIELIAQLEERRNELTKTRAQREKEAEEGTKKAAAAVEKANRELLQLIRNRQALQTAHREATVDMARQAEEASLEFADKWTIAAAKEKDRHRDNLTAIEANFQKSQQNAEARRLRDQAIDSEGIRNRLAGIDIQKQREQELADQRREDTYRWADQMEEVGGLLNQIFSNTGDNFLRKLGQALQYASRIASIIGRAGANEGGMGLTDFLGVFANVMGIGGLFDRGGYTGDGSRYEPAGIVHRGEVVFEKPLVDRYHGDIMSFRRTLQTGFADGGFTGGAIGGSPLLNELRLLRRTVREIEVQQPIVFRNILDSQKIVREELPAATAFQKQKHA